MLLSSICHLPLLHRGCSGHGSASDSRRNIRRRPGSLQLLEILVQIDGAVVVAAGQVDGVGDGLDVVVVVVVVGGGVVAVVVVVVAVVLSVAVGLASSSSSSSSSTE